VTAKNLGLAVCVTIWTYLVLTFVLGDKGIVAYAAVERYKIELEAHVEELSVIHDDLVIAARRLQSDPEQIRIESRLIGYIRPDEGIIRIPGRRPVERSDETPGVKLGPPEPWRADRSFLRALALSAGLLAFFLLQMIFRASK
jgi:cell division protein FtsB